MKTKQTTSSRLVGTVVYTAIALLTGAGLAACRGERTEDPPRQFLPDMDDSPKVKPQTQSDFFEDGRSMRLPVAGTVAFGYSTDAAASGRAWSLADEPAIFEGIDTTKPADPTTKRPAYQAVVPEGVFERVIADAAAYGRVLSRAEAVDHMLDRGQERFNIYCSACHGYQGEGGGGLSDGNPYGGLVGRRWMSPIPTYHDAKYKDRAVYTGQDGYLFSVIRHGVPNTTAGGAPKMPGYADKISVADSWAIVLYLRALQASRTESLEGLPAEERQMLEQKRPPASRSAIDGSGPAIPVAPPVAPPVAATETTP